MPIDYRKYHPDWKTKIRPAILKRAGDRCEKCRVKNYEQGYRDDEGDFVPIRNDAARNIATLYGRKVFRIVLTVAHVNHDITDNRPENLRAWCQKCHLEHDQKHHQISKLSNDKGRFYERFSC